jgi:hypothetical protein
MAGGKLSHRTTVSPPANSCFGTSPAVLCSDCTGLVREGEKLGPPCSLDVLKGLAIEAQGSAISLGRTVSFLKGLRLRRFPRSDASC